MKKVTTLDRRAFSAACCRLYDKVTASGFVPGAVVGIRTGGEFVALEIWRSCSRSGGEMAAVPLMATVELRRPTTSGKKALKPLLPKLPRTLVDMLRIVESEWLSFRRPSAKSMEARKAVVAERLSPFLRCLGGIKVLLVDDAVDSGATMSIVRDVLAEANPDADIRTAALTVTTRRPLFMPDYSLTTNLIRFPWSMDAKK